MASVLDLAAYHSMADTANAVVSVMVCGRKNVQRALDKAVGYLCATEKSNDFVMVHGVHTEDHDRAELCMYPCEGEEYVCVNAYR